MIYMGKIWLKIDNDIDIDLKIWLRIDSDIDIGLKIWLKSDCDVGMGLNILIELCFYEVRLSIKWLKLYFYEVN